LLLIGDLQGRVFFMSAFAGMQPTVQLNGFDWVSAGNSQNLSGLNAVSPWDWFVW
jgi:hypothetical protein